MNNKVESLIKKHMSITRGYQMEENEYYYISSFLGGKNFLVFGTGHDSNIWRESNKNGITLFLENKDEWINNEKDVYKVSYKTKLTEYIEILSDYKSGITDRLELEVPNIVKKIRWDYILVDSPEGWLNSHSGRMQSIYMAMVLANDETGIFVHDCDREVEDLYTKEMFKTEIRKLNKLKHFKK